MSTIEERSLELNIVSAFNLKKVKSFTKQSCFVVVYVNPSKKISTKVDRTGGRNPCWNAKLVVTCDEKLFATSVSYVTVEIYCSGRITNKLLGTVTIPLNEVGRCNLSGATKPQVKPYPVRRRSGKIKGELNLAVKLGEKKAISTLPAPRVYGTQPAGHGSSYNSFPTFTSYGSMPKQQYYAYGTIQPYSPYGSQAQTIWRASPQF